MDREKLLVLLVLIVVGALMYWLMLQLIDQIQTMINEASNAPRT